MAKFWENVNTYQVKYFRYLSEAVRMLLVNPMLQALHDSDGMVFRNPMWSTSSVQLSE